MDLADEIIIQGGNYMNLLNKLSANPQSFWYNAAKQNANLERGAQWPPTDKEDDEDCLAEALRAAVDAYIDKMLKGLNALTEDEKAEKVAEFEAIHMPRVPTQENMAEFAAKVQMFKAALARLAEIEHNEMLITPAKAAEDEQDSIAGFVRSQIVANAPRQI